jgi:hypothetical protein
MTSSLQSAGHYGRYREECDMLSHMLLTYALGKFAAITAILSNGIDS